MKLRATTSFLAIAVIAISSLGTTSASAAARYITISAQGSVKVVPDAVRINATVTSVSDSSKSALSTASKVAAAVRTTLKAEAIDSKDISTQSVTVYPEYKYSNDGISTLVGYRASQAFTIVVRAASNSGTVIDALVAAAGDNITINSASPFVLDSSKAAVSARSVAVKNAKAKALSYASLLGVKLGKVNYLVENSSPASYAPVMAVSKAESDSTVVDLGEQDVSVSITIQWALA